MPKVLAWNIRHGGGSRSMGSIALSLLEHAPDVLVLNEFRWSTGGQILGALADHGWGHRMAYDVPSRSNAVVLASRHPLRPIPLHERESTLAPRLAAAEVPALGLTLVGVHIPCSGREKQAFWNTLVSCADRLAGVPTLVIGDFNSGRRLEDEEGSSLSGTRFFARLAGMGYRDAWRRTHPGVREFSWFSHAGRGVRIDHAWVSAPLAERVAAAWYSHEERESGISDHSALVVALDPEPRNAHDFKENRAPRTCRTDDVAVQDGA